MSDHAHPDDRTIELAEGIRAAVKAWLLDWALAGPLTTTAAVAAANKLDAFFAASCPACLAAGDLPAVLIFRDVLSSAAESDSLYRTDAPPPLELRPCLTLAVPLAWIRERHLVDPTWPGSVERT